MLVEAQQLKLYARDRLLLDIPTLHIAARDRIGLVGRNGSGKTTLMEVIAGLRTPDEGQVVIRTRSALIPQLKRSDSTKSGGELTQEAILHALQDNPELLLADEPTTNLDTSHIEWLERKLQAWSGAFMIISHDRTFLDACCTQIWDVRDGKLHTYKGNYTDYAQQRELEKRQHDEAYDQYMQEKKVLERAIRAKEDKAARATKKPKNVSPSEAKITGAKPYFAKKQKKLQKTAKTLETRLEKLEKVEKRRELPPIKMDLRNTDTTRGRVIIRVQELSGQIGDRNLWEAVSFNVQGGEKLAIIGPNGCGKSTLVKTLMSAYEQQKAEHNRHDKHDRHSLHGQLGQTVRHDKLEHLSQHDQLDELQRDQLHHDQLDPHKQREQHDLFDKLKVSPSVKIGYFSQNIDVLDLEKTILENVRSTSSQSESLIRTVLARLHFFRDDVYKPVAVLSGGERVKVALAKIFVSDVTTLVLDEPTNYLDIETIEALEQLLQDYEGTVIFVSHDRRLIRNVAERTLMFEDGRIHVVEGNTVMDEDESGTAARSPQKSTATTTHSDSSTDSDDRYRQEQLLLIETKISDVLGRLSLDPSDELEHEFQRLIGEKRSLTQDR